jgi:hypothetical protein
MPPRLRATRIVEWVGLAGAADAAYGRSTLFDREKATVGAGAVPILGAPWVGIVWHLIGAGGRMRQHRHQQELASNVVLPRDMPFLLVGHFGRAAATANKRPQP